MNINSIQSHGFKTNSRFKKTNQSKAKKQYYIKEAKASDYLYKGKLMQDTGVLELCSYIKGSQDSAAWYPINKDGSGKYSTCWNQNAIVYSKGMLSHVYNEAVNIYNEQGKITQEYAIKLIDKINKPPFLNKPCSVVL